jgi:hypothetical protein
MGFIHCGNNRTSFITITGVHYRFLEKSISSQYIPGNAFTEQHNVSRIQNRDLFQEKGQTRDDAVTTGMNIGTFTGCVS